MSKHYGDLSDDQVEELRAAALFLSRGRMGSFSAHIGYAMLVADPANLDRLSAAFPELIRRAWDWIETENKIGA
jgi:hypothetical protein